MLCAVASCVAALEHAWALAFWLFLIGLWTDFLDGLAAKKLRAETKLGSMLDPLADSSLIVSGAVGMIATGLLEWWIIALALCGSLIIARGRLVWPNGDPRPPYQKMSSIFIIFAGWIYIIFMYATAAYGWSWWYLILTVGLLAFAATFKRHRLASWMSAAPHS